jgi:hypothetical protein
MSSDIFREFSYFTAKNVLEIFFMNTLVQNVDKELISNKKWPAHVVALNKSQQILFFLPFF